MQEIAPGLRRWTALHDHWEEDVGSVAVDTADGLVLIDPLDPPADLPSPKHVLLTLYWHARATGRAEGSCLGAGALAAAAAEPRRRGGGRRPRESFPGGSVPFPTARASEAVYWLPDHRAVVVGDVLLGAGAKPHATDDPLRLCPERWLGKATHEDLRVRCCRCSTCPSSTCSSRTANPWWGTGSASSLGC